MPETTKAKAKPAFSPSNAFKSLDMFGEGIGFSIYGRGVHQSYLGALVSLIAIVVTLSYALDRAQTMLEYNDTTHQETRTDEEYTIDAPLEYNESGVQIAVTIVNALTFTPDLHPDGYLDVKFNIVEWGWSQGELGITETVLPTFVCTEDYLKTHYTDITSTKKLDLFSNASFCITDPSSISLFGSDYSLKQVRELMVSIDRCKSEV